MEEEDVEKTIEVEVEIPSEEEDPEERADRISAHLQSLDWSLVFDERKQQYYYWNKSSHETRWECPPIPRLKVKRFEKIKIPKTKIHKRETKTETKTITIANIVRTKEADE